MRGFRDETLDSILSPWAAAWSEAIRESADAGRLKRGIEYLAEDAVEHMTTGPGFVEALVRGSEAEPYSVYIELTVLGGERRTLDGIDAGPLLSVAAQSGDRSLMQLLIDAGLPLVPEWHELSPFCTCPDPVTPCKHIVAVGLAAAERIDEEPNTLLQLLGVPTWSEWFGEVDEDAPPDVRALVAAFAESASAFMILNERRRRTTGRPKPTTSRKRVWGEDEGRAEAGDHESAIGSPAASERVEGPTVDPIRFWEGEGEMQVPPRGALNEPGDEPPWVYLPPEPYPLQRGERSYAEVMHWLYRELRAGASAWLAEIEEKRGAAVGDRGGEG